MKKFLVFLLGFLLPAICHAQAISFLQSRHGTNQTSMNFVGCTGCGNSAAHDALFAFLTRSTAAATFNVTDSNSDTWHAMTTLDNLPNFTSFGQQVWYTCDINVGTTLTPTITFGVSSGVAIDANIVEVQNLKTGSSTACFDAANHTTYNANTGTSGTPWGSGTFGGNFSNEIVLGYGQTDLGTISKDTGFSNIDASLCGAEFCVEYKLVNSGTWNATFKSSTTNDSAISQGGTFEGSASAVSSRHRLIQSRTNDPPELGIDPRVAWFPRRRYA